MGLGHLLLLAALMAPPDVAALRRELDEVAARIEQLKARRLAGESEEGELEPLLIRSQELADQLERALPEPAPPGPSQESAADPDHERADELREVATALRGQAGRLAGTLAPLEARISAALHAAMAASSRAPASPRATRAVATEVSGGPDRTETMEESGLSALVLQRMRLEASIRALRAQAAKLDAEADALETE